MPALAQQLPHAVPVIAMLLVVWVLTETPRLLSLAGVFVRPMRTDPGVLWGCGVVAGGYASMWALAHPGYSEHYFWTVTIGLSTVMTVTNAARVLPAPRRAWTLAAPLLAVAVLGVAAGYATTTFGRVNLDAPVRTVIEGRLRPFALVVPALVVAVLVTVLLRMLSRRWTLPLLTAATAFCLAAGLPVTLSQLSAAQPPRMQPLPKVGASYLYIAPEQERAALWLQRHSAPTAVVATNMFCWPMGKDTPHCRINSAWLGGLTGRRMVLGDWTYTSVNMSHYDGTAQLDSMPAPWPERRSLSTEAVEQPDSSASRTPSPRVRRPVDLRRHPGDEDLATADVAGGPSLHQRAHQDLPAARQLRALTSGGACCAPRRAGAGSRRHGARPAAVPVPPVLPTAAHRSGARDPLGDPGREVRGHRVRLCLGELPRLHGGGDPGLLRGDELVDEGGLADVLALGDLRERLSALQCGPELLAGHADDARRRVEVKAAVPAVPTEATPWAARRPRRWRPCRPVPG